MAREIDLCMLTGYGCKRSGAEAGLEGDRVRNTVRLEEERRAAKSPVIHCYGHGGRGCVALELCSAVGRLMEKYVKTTALQSNIWRVFRCACIYQLTRHPIM